MTDTIFPGTGNFYALLIISTCNLYSSINDAAMLGTALLKKGIPRKNIVFLTNNSTLKRYIPSDLKVIVPTNLTNCISQIRTTFNGFASDAKKNTSKLIVVVSSHGGLTSDKNKDEPFGKDNVFQLNSNILFVDDNFLALFKLLPSTFKVLTLLDFCHAGTGCDVRYIIDNKKKVVYDYYPKNSTSCSVCSIGACTDNQVDYEVEIDKSYISTFVNSQFKTYTESNGDIACGPLVFEFIYYLYDRPDMSLNLTDVSIIRDNIQAMFTGAGISQLPVVSTSFVPSGYKISKPTSNTNRVLKLDRSRIYLTDNPQSPNPSIGSTVWWTIFIAILLLILIVFLVWLYHQRSKGNI